MAIELRFYVPLDTKQVISETFFPADLLASTEQTKPNTKQQKQAIQEKIDQVRMCLSKPGPNPN